MIKVGIYGGTGYMGGELIRILLEHPQAEIAWVTARSGGDIAYYHPNLYGVNVKVVHPDETSHCDVVFLALPTNESIQFARSCLEKGSKVIDLGAAFRLKDRDIWENVYNQRHSDWELAEEAVYGIVELHLKEIQRARLVANPGCFSSAAILGLAPLIKRGILDSDVIIVDGLSGTVGVGAELSRAAHHPEIANNLVPYNAVNHRHTYEMEQELSLLAGKQVIVNFTPIYVPIVRGILDICHARYSKSISREDILSLYRDYYKNDPFIKIYDLPKEDNASWQYRPYPWVSSVAGTNYCFIGCDIDTVRKRIVIFSVLDSIGKGGAQVGIENMNLMFNLNRTSGLLKLGSHPA
jgi:N-acetyl-gamma-glutamyl-phosphate reductase common form